MTNELMRTECVFVVMSKTRNPSSDSMSELDPSQEEQLSTSSKKQMNSSTNRKTKVRALAAIATAAVVIAIVALVEKGILKL